MESFIRDVLFAFRSLRRQPAFAITAVLTIALGIGATSAIFSVVNAVMLAAAALQRCGAPRHGVGGHAQSQRAWTSRSRPATFSICEPC